VTISSITDIEFGEELPVFEPDTSLETVKTFAKIIGWGGARFSDHEAARKEGFPGAIVPGILSQGYLVAMIHQWAPQAEIKQIDTIFRAAVVADESHQITGVVTDINEDENIVEIDITVVNSKGETRVFGTASVEITSLG